MKTLQDYTDEELREELKRRAQEKRKNMKYEIFDLQKAKIIEIIKKKV